MEPLPERHARTGRYDDFLAPLARAEHERVWKNAPRTPEICRFCLLPLILVGRLFELAARIVPPDWFAALHDWALRKAAGRSGGLPFDDGEGLRGAQALLRSAEGRTPALLCLMSHPPVTEEEIGLNAEMARHAIRGLRLLRARPCRPKIVVGVDPFALSGLDPVREPLYRGFMGHYHLGMDRQAHAGGSVERRLMADTAWPTVALRIAACLSSGGEVAMVMAGGVPTTSRILYAAREFLIVLRRDRPIAGSAGRPASPFEVLARLESTEEFQSFRRSQAATGALNKSAWRVMELWLTTLLADTRGPDAAYARAERGELATNVRRALCACAAALGYGPEETAARLAGLEEEFGRKTPYRVRFFRFLLARVVAKGTPVLLLPLVHHGSPRSPTFGEPCLLTGLRFGSRSSVLLRRPGAEQQEEDLSSFAMDFVGRNFS